MSVAEKTFFSKEHILSHRFNASEVLAEQAIHCLELVSQLTMAGLDFQFKGGNSLLLILSEPQRFSIDVDIATNEKRERIEEILDLIVGEYGVFTKWEKRQHKTKPWLPIASYYVFYNSHFVEGPTSIMLDAQLRRSPYKTEWKQVGCGELYLSNVRTEVPLPSSIIGDKLLTLGPTTLGIPLGKKKEAQRLKHVFDIARLTETNPSIDSIRESFKACLEHENSLQERVITENDIVIDTLNFCFSVSNHEQIPIFESVDGILAENARGLRPFSEHLFRSEYSWRDLQNDMSRVALCIAGVANTSIMNTQFESIMCQSNSDFIKNNFKSNPFAQKCWSVIASWRPEIVQKMVEAWKNQQ